ncbi:hypothetical protein F0U62_48240 [Cystobacter fuscus]|uniref:hypothetical protein n=1 Tax=Cystobacter fuscus TaxID=43 RepID=UPI002B2CFDFC|nr:hypothetical protein F0U62_48240 [Cystobacter fuscus]
MNREFNFGVVAFLDILGFASMVETDAKAVLPKNLDSILSALEEVRSDPDTKFFNLRAFSDSIVLSSDLEPGSVLRLIELVGLLQRRLIRRGVLIRGGIAFGKHYSDAEVVYSEALIRAYRLESQFAKFPRVIVDSNLLDWLFNHKELPQAEGQKGKARLLKDRDMLCFVAYLESGDLESHAALVRERAAKLGPDKAILEKVQWLADYNNFVAEKLGRSECIVTDLALRFSSV